MAVQITLSDVRDVIETNMSDTLVESYIGVVEERVGPCIDLNYSDNTGMLIKSNLVAYLISDAEGNKEVRSRRAPNGASVTFEDGVSERGIQSNQYGKIVYMLDQQRCWTNLVPRTAFMGSAGPKANSTCGYRRRR